MMNKFIICDGCQKEIDASQFATGGCGRHETQFCWTCGNTKSCHEMGKDPEKTGCTRWMITNPKWISNLRFMKEVSNECE